MKKIYIFALCLSIGMISGCSNFLDEDNKVGETADLTYNTSSGIKGLAASCYSFARGWYGKEAALGLSEMGTDLFYYGYDNKQKSMLQYNITSKSLGDNVADNPCLDQYWELFYCAVDACNNLLKYAESNSAIGTAEKIQYKGDGYFLRAFYYFHMVNIWGPIPYISEPIDVINSNPIRMPEEEIYNKIISDLDQSINSYKEVGIMNKTQSEGRANYWAAKALKSRVLLYYSTWLNKDKFAEAQALAEEVISGSRASFYPNYADTWSMVNEEYLQNNEALFDITYSGDLNTTSNCIPKRYVSNNRGYNGLITNTGTSRGGNMLLLMFVSMWNNGANDLGGNGTKNNNVFVRAVSEATSYIISNETGESVFVADHYSPYGRGWTRYLPSLYLMNLMEKNRGTDQRPEATILDAYTIASPKLRKNATNYPLLQDTAIFYSAIDGNSAKGKSMQEWAKNRYRIQFAYNGDIPLYTSGDPSTAIPTEVAKDISDVYNDARYNNFRIGGWCSFPGLKKFITDVYDPAYRTHDISSKDVMVLRLAEMYLIKAECQLHTSNGKEALNTINELRKFRAIEGKNNSLKGTADLNTILDERALEFCGEQQRWFDLKRTHTLLDRVKTYNAQSSSNIKEYHYYRPIPDNQLETINNFTTEKNSSTGFWQNEGY